jgi:mRNA interferase RelE/StbE
VSYSVFLRRSVQRELERVPSPFYEKIEEKLLSLRENPRPSGSKLLQGAEKSWRVRIGDYRLIYEIDDKTKLITVIKIGHRREVYR